MSDADGSAGGSRVIVHRWTTTYLVPRDHPAPDALRGRLDQALDTGLADSCAREVARRLDPADPAVWRIRELRLDISFDAGSGAPGRAPDAWAGHLAARIGEIVERREESDSVLRFPDRAAYLAEFLADLAAGRAWGRWCYAEFDGLRGLSTGRALGETFVREPAWTARIVRRLADAGRFEEILEALPAHEARRVWETCRARAAASAETEQTWVSRVLAAWDAAPLRPPGREEQDSHDALRLAARLGERFPGAEADGPLLAAVAGLVAARRALAAVRSPVARERLIRELARGVGAGALAAAHAADADAREGLAFFARVMDGDAHWGGQTAAVLLREHFQAGFPATAVAEGETILSDFGGVFLLAPSWQETDVADIADAAGRHAAALRHLAAVQCLGRARAAGAARDAAVRLFSGFDGPDLAAAFAEWTADPPDLARMWKLLIRALVSRGRCDARCLLAEVAALPGGGQVLLWRDVWQDEWIFASVLTTDPAAALAADWSFLQPCLPAGPATRLLLRGPFDPSLRAAGLPPDPILLPAATETGPAEELASALGMDAARLVRAIRPAEPALAYFSLHGLFPAIPPDADGLGALLARAALRHFSRRLVGFQGSSPDYLYRNFLAGVASIHTAAGSIEVRGPDSPLAMVQRLSGVWEQTLRAPWLHGTTICLQPTRE